MLSRLSAYLQQHFWCDGGGKVDTFSATGCRQYVGCERPPAKLDKSGLAREIY